MSTTNENLVKSTTWQDTEGDFPNCTDVEVGLKTLYLHIIYSIIFLRDFPGNVIAICICSFKMRPWKSSTIIILNLALKDLFHLASPPFLIHDYASGEHWIFGEFMCKLIHFSFHFNLYGSILFLTCFSTFCYMVIVHNFVYPIKCLFLQKRRWAVVTCIVIWMISLVALSPLAVLIAPSHKQNRTICPDLTAAEDLDTSRWYNWILTVFAFFLPLLTVTLCYVLIIYTLTTGPHTRAGYKQKARRLAVVLLMVFYVCFLPFHVFRGIRLELRARPVSCQLKKTVLLMFIITKPLAALNTFGNLLLYVVSGDNFQQAILSL
ncbi:OXGR1 protein, partial [Calyptomena viridis]|nr:OXGR1 protein [Calyptomena viridis]